MVKRSAQPVVRLAQPLGRISDVSPSASVTSGMRVISRVSSSRVFMVLKYCTRQTWVSAVASTGICHSRAKKIPTAPSPTKSVIQARSSG